MLETSQLKEKLKTLAVQAKNILAAVFVPTEDNCFLPHALKARYLFLYSASLLILKIAIIAAVLILPSTDFFSTITSQQLISLINQERQARNLPALAINTSLNSVAELKVNDMLDKNYFEHTSPSGVTPWHWFKQIGYNYLFAGENLAMGFTETEAVFNAWMNSPTHRDNILNPNYREIGLAVKTGQIQNHQDTLAVLEFGRQKSLAVQAPAAPTSTPTPASKVKGTSGPTPTKSAMPIAVPATSPIPSAIAAASQSPAPSPEQIELKTILGTQPENNGLSGTGENVLAPSGYAPRVLGAFVSKSDEIFKSLYLYFTLFLAIALLVNIFVKFKFQCWPTIVTTTIVILLSTALIFI